MSSGETWMRCYRVAVDGGGTFTDRIAHDEAGGAMRIVKTRPMRRLRDGSTWPVPTCQNGALGWSTAPSSSAGFGDGSDALDTLRPNRDTIGSRSPDEPESDARQHVSRIVQTVKHRGLVLNHPFRRVMGVSPRSSASGDGDTAIAATSPRPNSVTFPGIIPYPASKIALHGRVLAIALAPHKINVNAIAPGNIQTPLNDVLYFYMADLVREPGNRDAGKRELVKSYPLGRLGVPEDISPIIVYLASDAADFVTGQIFTLDGGYTAP